MNKPTVYGGVGEYGRTCFYVEAGEYSLLLDAGIMKGKGLSPEETHPQIPASLIPALDIIWLSHSHIDHTGFLPQLVSRGFQGKIISSLETQKQLLNRADYQAINEQCEWETLDYKGKIMEWTIQRGHKPPLYGRCGASGHMIGSLWLSVNGPTGSFVYTGDMSIDSVLYKWDDSPCETPYSWGIIDQGYNEKRLSQTENEKNLYSFLLQSKQNEEKLVFPLPKYGRSLEMLLLLFRFFKEDCPPLYIDLSIYRDAKKAAEQLHWIQNEVREEYKEMINWVQENARALKDWYSESNKGSALIILADSGLEQHPTKELLSTLKDEDNIVLTGNPGKGTYAEAALKSEVNGLQPKVSMLPYNVHLSVRESKLISSKWSISLPIYFHGEHNPSNQF